MKYRIIKGVEVAHEDNPNVYAIAYYTDEEPKLYDVYMISLETGSASHMFSMNFNSFKEAVEIIHANMPQYWDDPIFYDDDE